MYYKIYEAQTNTSHGFYASIEDAVDDLKKKLFKR